jgi:hypothetical protein
LERTAAAVDFICGRTSRVRRRGRSTALRYSTGAAMRFGHLLATFVAMIAVTASAFGESWPTLEKYAKDCVLIVRVKQVGAYSDRDGAALELKVLETWVGKFDPKEFTETKDGHIVAHFGEHGMKLKEGQEAIVFYTRHNQPADKLASHSTAFPIDDEKVVYGSMSESERQTLTVKDFRSRIEQARK